MGNPPAARIGAHRLLFVIDTLRCGGAERQLVTLLKGLAAVREWELELVILSDEEAFFRPFVEALGVPIHCFARRYTLDLAGPISEVARLIKQNGICLVHAFLNLGSLVGVAGAKLAGVPVVCSAIREGKDENWKLALSKRMLARLSDVFVSNSKAGLVSRFKRARPHFKVVYNGIDFSRFDEPFTSYLATQLSLTRFDRVVGMVGRLSNHKDYPTFLQAAAMVLGTMPNTGFLIVGDGPMRHDYECLSIDLGIREQVVFAGYRADVDRIYTFMNLFVLLNDPDVHEEGLSNALIEAAAVGIPMIATDAGGTPEIIEHDCCGILVPPQDPRAVAAAIADLLRNEEKAKTLADEAKKKVRGAFALGRYIKEYEQIYRSLLAGR